MVLTQRQRQIITKKNLVQYRKEGLTYAEIAKKLKMKTATLYYYYYKLGIRNGHKHA